MFSLIVSGIKFSFTYSTVLIHFNPDLLPYDIEVNLIEINKNSGISRTEFILKCILTSVIRCLLRA